MDIVQEAQELYEKDKSAWASIYRAAKDDLKFLSDDDDAQWDPQALAARRAKGRPALTIDQLGQFVHQTANDVRMNTPTINVIPSGMEADQDTAEIFKGLIKNIEYSSQADTAYDTAVTSAVKCSIGFIRVDHDYADEVSMDQELLIKRVINPLSVYIDSNSVEVDGSDAKHGYIIEEIPVTEFKSRFKGKDVASFGEAIREFKDDEKVKICEFFKIVEETREIGAKEDGSIEDKQEGMEYKNSRKIKRKKVMRYTLSGKEVLEETRFPGKYIPIVPVYGEEAWEDGKRKLHSLIRKSKNAQQMYNYWKSLETELLMKQPQASVMAAVGQIEDFATDWQNPDKPAVLRFHYNDAKGNPVGAPQRLEPPVIPSGVVNAARATVDDIKATMGIYNAALGQKSNETSGVAINQRKIEGDMATYHFGDNLVKSITHVGRILVCAIPEIYDTQRVIRIIGEEEEPKEVGINGQSVEGQEKSFDLSQGKYEVKVVTGAPFTTRRQEAAQFYSEIVSKRPELLEVMGDLLFKYQDFTGASAMAERMKKAINPKFIDEEDQDPEKLQMQQAMQEAQQMIQALQSQLQDKQQSEQAKNQLELMKLQQEAQQSQTEAEIKMAELALKEKELELKFLEMQARASQPPVIEQSGSMQ